MYLASHLIVAVTASDAIEREDFETLGLDFKEHVAAQHNMWDYLFFRLYLEAKDPSEFNGLETYCWEQQQEGRITWFPIKKAIVIEGRNKEKKDIPGLYTRLGSIEARAAEQAVAMRKMRERGLGPDALAGGDDDDDDESEDSEDEEADGVLKRKGVRIIGLS